MPKINILVLCILILLLAGCSIQPPESDNHTPNPKPPEPPVQPNPPVENTTQAPSDQQESIPNPETPTYPIHTDITVTFFWVGEEATRDNDYIQNRESAWDERWLEHYGGVDDPDTRDGYYPRGFTPEENPFYFALPYNDFDENSERKPGAMETIYWAEEQNWTESESMCKNRWIKITKGDKSAYAQWEDVGPFGEDDADYVFGSAQPKNRVNRNAGLDVSPAVRDYLNLEDIDTVSWRFIDFEDVPDGPWKDIITTSNSYWE
ncbi:MAG: hypothetical protein ABIE94_05415 [archaeon]